jgi:DNA-binding transcriptional LysR family regulator
MEPTPRTEGIIDKTREVLEQIDQEILSRPAFDPAQATDQFTFCMTAIAEFVFLPHLFATLRREAPKASIRCVSLTPNDLRDSLANGSVDLAVGFYPDLVSADFFQQRLFSHNLVCLVRDSHPLKGPGMTIEEFCQAEHVDVRDGSRSSEMFEQVLANNRLERNIVLTTSHYMCLPPVVAEADVIAVAPKIVASIFAERYGLRMLPMPVDLPEYDLKQHWHRKFHHDPRLIWLRSLLHREFCKSYLAHLMDSLAA